MAKRDPVKTARNAIIRDMKVALRSELPKVLAETGIASEASLNAMIGGKAAEFIDLKHDVIASPDQYINLYMKGFKARMSPPGSWANSHRKNYEIIKSSKAAQRYFLQFLKRSYLNHAEELSRVRPHVDESEIWIGQNNADYGLLITPRFNPLKNSWENDKSEIRHFPKRYWTIGHVLKSGLVVPDDDDKIEFDSVEEYLLFFKNILVRASGSKHERAIAKLYCDFVRTSDDPESMPLLIPEFRFEGREKKHKFRLDFTIIDPFTMSKVGYELSPWSTHGYLSKIGGLTQAQINDMAKDNFEKEMVKHRSFFKKYGLYALIYTDGQLAKPELIFDDMRQYLQPIDKVVQLDLDLMTNFFK
ncbi:MAG: topoisomerase II [Brevundimonas sp.]|uniref:topoisomerase II n=1 Tax=Brevundimonas sp. TaxID=1871086 RepID=UPI00403463B3